MVSILHAVFISFNKGVSFKYVTTLDLPSFLTGNFTVVSY